MDDANDSHWNEYTELQRVKHELLRCYLGAWFAILGSSHPGFVYLETHAGRGRFGTGEPGSPIVALNTLLTHRFRDRLLGSVGATFILIEEDETNALALENEVRALGRLPARLSVHIIRADYETELQSAVSSLSPRGGPPMFMFVDPFGFKLRMDLLHRYLQQDGCEVLLNFMWRNMSQALGQPTTFGPLLDATFGQTRWERLGAIQDFEQRCDAALGLLSARLGADHSRDIKMLGPNGVIKYVLLHLANHRLALRKMNEVLWALSPEGDFRVRQSDNPDQPVLFSREPDLTPLAELLWSKFGGRCARTDEVDETSTTFWLPKHSHAVMRDWHQRGALRVVGQPKLVFSHNPEVEFVTKPVPILS